MNQNWQELIWKVAGGEATAAEVQLLEQAMLLQPELAEHLEEARQLHSMLRAMTPEQPSMRFAKNILDKLATRSAALVSRKTLYRLGAAFALFCAASLGLAVLFPESPMLDWLKIPQFNFAMPAWFTGQAALLAAIGTASLGLLLLDHFFLRPRFRSNAREL